MTRALTLLGESDVAVYDGSLYEWTSNPELPLEVGSGLDASNCDRSCVEDGQRAGGRSDHGARGVRYNAFGERDPGTSLDHRAGRSE